MGTGALPIVTQSLLSELPANAESQPSDPPGVSSPLPTADPLSAASQSWAAGPPDETSSAVRAELQDAAVSSASDSHAASQTPVISGQGTARLLGTDTQLRIMSGVRRAPGLTWAMSRLMRWPHPYAIMRRRREVSRHAQGTSERGLLCYCMCFATGEFCLST